MTTALTKTKAPTDPEEVDALGKSAARRAETATQGSPQQIRAQQEADEWFAYYYDLRDATDRINDLDSQIAATEQELAEERVSHAAPNTAMLTTIAQAGGVVTIVSLAFAMITGGVVASLIAALAATAAITAWVRAAKIKQQATSESHEAVDLQRKLNDLEKQRKNALPSPPEL